jgi:hypothetical protein
MFRGSEARLSVVATHPNASDGLFLVSRTSASAKDPDVLSPTIISMSPHVCPYRYRVTSTECAGVSRLSAPPWGYGNN